MHPTRRRRSLRRSPRGCPSSHASPGSHACTPHRAVPMGTVCPEPGSTILPSTCGSTVPTVLTRRSRSSSRPRDERHGCGLGHAVPDADLVGVHLVDDALHDLDGAWRARHDPGPQRGRVELLEPRVLEHRDEHRRDAVHGWCTAPRPALRASPADRSLRRGTPSSIPTRCSPGCRSPCRSSGTAALGCRRGRSTCIPCSAAIAWALFKMLWCVSVAPLGLPVVPLVYWMLMGSSVSSCSSR